MREIVTICLGQAGVQLGHACWELFCLEHMIRTDGTCIEKPELNLSESTLSNNVEHTLSTFFNQGSCGSAVPRSIMVDLEPTVIDEIRTGVYRNLFHPDTLISGLEDAANNFARGRYTCGKTCMPMVKHQLRNIVERCDSIAGFMHMHSYGGGTGAGMGALLTEVLKTTYTKTPALEMAVYPASRYSSATVEPYNAIHSVHSSLNDSELVTVFDNECLYRVAENNLQVHRPSYSSLNRITSQIYSSITSSLRFAALVDNSIPHILTNTIPYPRIHFMSCSYAPLCSSGRMNHLSLSVREITDEVFDDANFMVDVDRSIGKYMSCSLQYRGHASPHLIQQALQNLKFRAMRPLDFVSWCPTGFKTGLVYQPSVVAPHSEIGASVRSCALICNHSSISQAWQRMSRKFEALFHKRAFIHWFVGEGMEECEFGEAIDDVYALMLDYKNVVGDDDDEGDDHEETEIDHAMQEKEAVNTELLSRESSLKQSDHETPKSLLPHSFKHASSHSPQYSVESLTKPTSMHSIHHPSGSVAKSLSKHLSRNSSENVTKILSKYSSQQVTESMPKSGSKHSPQQLSESKTEPLSHVDMDKSTHRQTSYELLHTESSIPLNSSLAEPKSMTVESENFSNICESNTILSLADVRSRSQPANETEKKISQLFLRVGHKSNETHQVPAFEYEQERTTDNYYMNKDNGNRNNIDKVDASLYTNQQYYRLESPDSSDRSLMVHR